MEAMAEENASMPLKGDVNASNDFLLTPSTHVPNVHSPILLHESAFSENAPNDDASALAMSSDIPSDTTSTPHSGELTLSSTPVPVPKLDQSIFVSWEDFHAYIRTYEGQTYQHYIVRTATPTSHRNSIMTKRNLSPLIPQESFPVYVKTLVCTHAGKPRLRAKGDRSIRGHRSLECPARINACVQRRGANWHVVVTSQHACHNHAVNQEIYKRYPRVRNALSSHVQETVAILARIKIPHKKILEYVKEADGNAQMSIKDLQNLLRRLKAT